MKQFSIFALLLFFISGCAKKIDAPVWVTINAWDLQANPLNSGSEGELTQNITEAWVNVDNKFIGVFELPIKIPIIAEEGEHEFIIIPGIINNGISATKKRYPFMEQYKKTFTLTSTDTVAITPTTQYYTGLNFFIEDFENPNNLKVEADGVSNTTFTASNNPDVVKYGNYCGHIPLNSSDSLMYGYTNVPLYLPKQGAEVYLEIDYYNTNSLLTSVIAVTNGDLETEPNISLNAQTSPVWKKIYIDLKEIVSYQNADYYFMGLTAILDEVGSSKDVFIDNIKVVYN